VTDPGFGAFNVEALYLALDKRRRERRITWRQIGREANLANQPSLMTHIARGARPSANNLVRLLLWLGETDLKPYIHTSGDGAA